MKVVALLAVILNAATASAQKIALTPLGSFGCEDCDTPLLFSSLQAITVSPRGEIVVVDRSNPRVRVFDARGRLLRSLGATGKGPGEIGTAQGIGITATGEYDVLDQDLGRLTRLNPSGRETGSLALGGFVTSAASAPGGAALLFSVTSPRDTTLKLQLLSNLRRTVVFEAGPSLFPQRAHDIVTAPFALALDGSFAIGEGGSSYSIFVYDATGKRKFEMHRAIERVKKSAAEIAAQSKRGADQMAQMAQTMKSRNPSVKPVQPAAPAIPPLREYFTYEPLRYDEAGRLWVHVDRGSSKQSVFDVFDRDGRFIGESSVDAAVTQFALGNGLLAAIVVDDVGVERVRTWTVAQTPRAPK